MNNLDQLYAMLKKAGVTDAQIKTGVRLTDAGLRTLCDKFNITEIDAKAMLVQLRGYDFVTEDNDMKFDTPDRFSYESDVLGNVAVRDSQSGKEIFLQGNEAFDLLYALETYPDKVQDTIGVIFAQPLSETTLDEDDFFGDMKSNGTFNFVYDGNFATAKYWEEDGDFKIDIISLRDATNKEIPIRNKQRILDAAYRNIDSV